VLTGGGLHLITTYEVDALGRPTKTTDANGNITYAVYDDADHEARVYPGWNTSTHTTTGPTIVVREDRDHGDGYLETLTMTATPALDGSNLPTGGESIGSLQSLSRTYSNDAGQMVRTDDYFHLTGLTYAETAYIGTLNTNYYTTSIGYDERGRQSRVEDGAGTIYRTVYDGLGRPVSQWVGDDDTPTSGYWSPTNTGGWVAGAKAYSPCPSESSVSSATRHIHFHPFHWPRIGRYGMERDAAGIGRRRVAGAKGHHSPCLNELSLNARSQFCWGTRVRLAPATQPPATQPGTMGCGGCKMPLRDHFRPPLDDVHSWDELHGGWPMMIVQQLAKILPEPYFAAPSVHLGTLFEVDIGTFREPLADSGDAGNGNGGPAVATYAPPRPTLTLEPRLPNQDVYEVRIYGSRRHRRLVAAIEIVSPSNKDRRESRATFISKVATLIKNGICVSIVDVVSTIDVNLYAELLTFVNSSDPALGQQPPPLYAVTIRTRLEDQRRLMDTWYHPLAVGQALPTLPIWLQEAWAISLDLESSYEETCRTLRIP
jgi:YD repeat-containing protein